MWTVVVNDQGGQEVVRQEWAAGSLSIGRDAANKIVLPGKTASRKHARLDMVGGNAVIVDEGSSNGVIVNGNKITAPTRIDQTSQVIIGEFRLILQAPVVEEDESERTVLMKPKAFTAPPPPQPQVVSPPRPMPPQPQVVSPPRPMPPQPQVVSPQRPMPPPVPPHPQVVSPPRPMPTPVPPPRPAAPPPPPPPPPRAAPPPPPPPPPRPATPTFTPPPPPKPAMPDFPAPSFPSSPQSPGGNPYMGEHSDATSQFERHLQSVRSYREESQAQTLNKKGRIDAEWAKVVTSMRSLQTRLSADKRVLSFTISRDLREVAIKIADPGEKRGHRYFLMSRNHPDGKYPGIEDVWLREFGRDDASFNDPQKCMEELMLRVAGTLA